MNNILIVGIGNQQRGDDQLGFVVCDQLKQNLPESRFINFDGKSVDLMNLWSQKDHVILIDCTQTGSQPGTQFRFDVTDQPLPNIFSPSSTHALSIPEGIELARALGNMPKSLLVFGLEGQTFEIGSQMSKSVQKSIPLLIETITTEIERKLAHA